MTSVPSLYETGVVVRSFLNCDIHSFSYEISSHAATTLLCATFIKKGVPMYLINNMPQFRGIPKLGLLYHPDDLTILHAFKYDIYSDRFGKKENFPEKIVKSKKGKDKKIIPLPDHKKGGTKYHTDYETISGISEKITRMFQKYKKPLFHNELFIKAKEPKNPKKRIIGILIDQALFDKEPSLLIAIAKFALEHLPGCPFCLYYEEKGEIEELSINEMIDRISTLYKEKAKQQLLIVTPLRSKL